MTYIDIWRERIAASDEPDEMFREAFAWLVSYEMDPVIAWRLLNG